MSPTTFLCAATAIIALGVSGAAVTPVNVTVWYESLCPDSIRFVTEQLTPAFNKLGPPRMIVDFVPYGKASTIVSQAGISFRCQHGPSECRGNMAQACGLSMLVGNNTKQVDFVQCIMSADNPSTAGMKCALKAGLDAVAMESCSSPGAWSEGSKLLQQMGVRTPKLTFVPTVGFNGETHPSDQEAALYNLLHVVCDKLAPADRIPDCER